jgi:hypothetical protein
MVTVLNLAAVAAELGLIAAAQPVTDVLLFEVVMMTTW